MGAITIRDVPDETRAELAARAARSGRSMQEFVRLKLIEIAEAPEPGELVERMRHRKARMSGGMTVAEILDAKDADRR
jgi:antitoxin FitA